MRRYEPGDPAVFYFVIYDDGKHQQIQAWTDNKDYLDFYIEFHACPHFKVKKMRGTIEDIVKILNENDRDEIKIMNITTRDPKHPSRVTTIQIPATDTEGNIIRDNLSTFMSGDIDYTLLHEVIYYLKDEWLQALDDILLLDVINNVIYNKPSKRISMVELDALMVFARVMRDNFGI